MKNTPPITPRAKSPSDNEQQHANDQSSSPQQQQHTSQDEKDNISATVEELSEKLDETFPAGSSDDGSGSSTPQAVQAAQAAAAPTVGSLKGKLHVKISEARGMRPAYDPYVICVFEWNEFVSSGPQDEEEAALERRRIRKELEPPDGSGPMAIPMKSANSSGSLTELREHKEKAVTDPHWNLEAAL